MLERPITVICYNCLKTFDCNYLGHPVSRKCPWCSVVNRVPAPDEHGKSYGKWTNAYGQKLRMR